jgi:site-specific recombinase XerD
MPSLENNAPPPAATSELAGAVERFLASLARADLSTHTIRNYAADLKLFAEYFSPPGEKPPAPSRFDPLMIREFMADGFRRGNMNRSVARRVSALRAFFAYLVREGVVPSNPAKLVRIPKAPKTLPAVMTPEETNRLVDSVGAAPPRPGKKESDRKSKKAAAQGIRDRAIFELLYGCGLRVGELVGLNLDDFSWAERWIRALVVKLNSIVIGNAAGEKFIPFFVARYCQKTRVLEYVNAAHNPPVMLNISTCEVWYLHPSCVGIGMLDEIPAIKKTSITLRDHTKIVCYTDGLSELKGDDGKDIGTDEILKQISNCEPVENNMRDMLLKLGIPDTNPNLFDDVSILAVDLL